LTTIAYAEEHKHGHLSYDGEGGPSHRGDLNPDMLPARPGASSHPLTPPCLIADAWFQ